MVTYDDGYSTFNCLGFFTSSLYYIRYKQPKTEITWRVKSIERKRVCFGSRTLSGNQRVQLGAPRNLATGHRFSLRCCSAPNSENFRVSAQTERSNSFIWSSAVSVKADLTQALADVIARAISKFPNGRTVDLALLFVSSRYTSKRLGILSRGDLEAMIPHLRGIIPSLQVIVGCTSSGMVGHDVRGEPEEVEGAPAVSLLLASLPDVELIPFHIDASQIPDLDSGPDRWLDLVNRGNRSGVAPEDIRAMILLSEPHFCQQGYLHNLLQGLDFVYPQCSKVGTVACSRSLNERVQLIYSTLAFENMPIHEEGVVGIALAGKVRMDVITIPSYRQIGPNMVIRKCDKQCIIELSQDSSPNVFGSVERMLQQYVDRLSPKDKELAGGNVFLGLNQSSDGDIDSWRNYIVRKIEEPFHINGSLKTSEAVYVGQRVGFFIRDYDFAVQQAGHLFESFKRQQLTSNIEGSGPFATAGIAFLSHTKGMEFYRIPNYESTLFHSFMNVPLVGVFGGKEIASNELRDETLVYEYTSVFGILEEMC
ncbi:hypothetical protein Gasu2_43350 [Galdieria sulphuraria]|uniref:Zinc finger (CCCH-type) family protein n=1 Tax=Galdieria sulphuraria TaxID=130081 RepID=M2XVN4_GALSU|nr:zinc finger (CCCH-type) family protein [Galdieria sulphuraria]EME27713.1 zinc finger (CCCH-type) family protein [Galdieria sulphuraria]GJD10125.1 hypothetical protein Gasu2_43350 [Galdieria sulphuraria]|eukprot:XP_005704233.1 zinc finger (CCCH-type) family protein [Galdieria sulphuraria]